MKVILQKHLVGTATRLLSAPIRQTRYTPGIIQNGAVASSVALRTSLTYTVRICISLPCFVHENTVHACRMKAQRVRTWNNNVYKERYDYRADKKCR